MSSFIVSTQIDFVGLLEKSSFVTRFAGSAMVFYRKHAMLGVVIRSFRVPIGVSALRAFAFSPACWPIEYKRIVAGLAFARILSV